MNFKKVIPLTTLFLFLFTNVAFATGQVFDGGKVVSASSNIRGAKADILYNKRPNINTYYTFTCAWTMIEDTSGNLAQCGWSIDYISNYNDSNPKYFFGWANNADGHVYHEKRNSTYGPALGSTNTYTIQLDPDIKGVTAYVGSTNYGSTTIDWTPTAAEYSGECFDGASPDPTIDVQLPGKVAYHDKFSSVLYFNGNTSTWLRPSLSSNVNNTTIAGQNMSNYSSSGYFEIWDKRY